MTIKRFLCIDPSLEHYANIMTADQLRAFWHLVFILAGKGNKWQSFVDEFKNIKGDKIL
jgi:hypothetical protein